MKVFAPLLYGFALICALAASGSAQAAREPYEINALVPLTGGGAFLGSAYKEAFAAIESVVNRSGGIQGRPLKFVLSDTQTNPQVALQLVNGLIAKHVAVFIDGDPSGVCSASIPVVLNTGPLDYCLSPGVHPAAGSYVFSSSVSTEDLAKTLIRFFRARGWVHLGVITSTDTTGQDLDRQIATVLALPENQGVRVVAQEHFNTTDLSVVAQMARIKAASPDVLLTWSTGTPFGTLLHGINDVGIAVPVSSTNANQTYAQMKAYAAFLPKELYFPTTLSIAQSSDAPAPVRKAQDVYFSAFRESGVRADLAHNLVWDPALIIVDALKHLGPSATAQQLRDYILKLRSWTGVNGRYDFTTGDQRGLGSDGAAVDLWESAKGTWVQVSRPGGAPIATR
jgi:branched-chain amino acid transport system substrate-binding protein